jgi:hypothetical protein
VLSRGSPNLFKLVEKEKKVGEKHTYGASDASRALFRLGCKNGGASMVAFDLKT